MAITALPGATFEATVNGATTGQVGTITVRIEDGQDTVVTAATTAGIVESGVGIYTATLTAPATAGSYLVIWHDSGSETSEELTVSLVSAATAGYATATQVFALDTGRTYTPTGKPNVDQVVGYIAHTAAELDGILRTRGYDAPIATAATSAHALLAAFNAYGAIALVEQSAPTGGGKTTGWQTMWEQAKKMLACGDIELDAPRNSSSSSPRGFRSRGEMGFPASPMIPLTFET